MKRIKIMLTAVSIVAIVCGALAFNTQKFGAFCIYQKSADGLTCPRIGHLLFMAWQGAPVPSITSTNATTLAVVGGGCAAEADVVNCTTTVTFQGE